MERGGRGGTMRENSNVPATPEKGKSGEPRTIRLSEMIYDEGCEPSRIVLRRIGVHLITHMKVYPPTTDNKDPYYFWGHYFISLDDANKDFEERCRKYNVEEVERKEVQMPIDVEVEP